MNETLFFLNSDSMKNDSYIDEGLGRISIDVFGKFFFLIKIKEVKYH